MTSVYDGQQELRFEGELLGSSSSARAGKDRWNEILIYRTSGGKYIAAGIGRTNRPNETDRHWAHVCETAPGVLVSLYMFDADGVRYLTRTARQAIEEAARVDEDIHNSYYTSYID
jgi:hypothetical protein